MDNDSKQINLIWYSDYEIPNKYLKLLKHNKNINNKWNYKIWLKKHIDNLLNEIIPDIYNKLNYIQKIQLAKYCILFKHGGVYCDLDIKFIKPLDTIFKTYSDFDLYFSYKPFENNYFQPNKNDINISDSIIISCKKEDMIISNIIMDAHKYISNTSRSFLGPRYLTDNISPLNTDNKSGIVILPHYYFDPCSNSRKCKIINKTIAIHYHDKTWINISSFLEKLMYNLKIFLNSLFIFEKETVIMLIIIIFIISIYYTIQNILHQT